ncbi:MAG: hypothetical protein RIC55_33275 [Pirellulaceae bacterium]
MAPYELRDAQQARTYLLQSIWLTRTVRPSAESIEAALRWTLELVAGGAALPPVGLVLDVGQIALSPFALSPAAAAPPVDPPGVDAGLLRQYADVVLGKLYVDESFRRGADAAAHLPADLRDRGVAWLVERFVSRAGWTGAAVSPGVVRGLLEQSSEQIVEESWRSLSGEGLTPRLADDLRGLSAAIRDLGDVLAAEDVFEIEHGTALSGFGQRVALRQVISAAAELQQRLPTRPPPRRRKPRRRDASSRLSHDDAYPVGGFASIGNRGTIESLLHSQLAYMEVEDRPDLFDAKMLRGELLYFVRDENEFLRSHRTFVFLLDESLCTARVKDARAPWQRIVGTLAWLTAAVRRLQLWLGKEALRFEFWFVARRDPPDGAAPTPLAPEKQLLELLLREQLVHGAARMRDVDRNAVEDLVRQARSQGQLDWLVVAGEPTSYPSAETLAARLLIRGPTPELQLPDLQLRDLQRPDGAPLEDTPDVLDAWAATLNRLLATWM